MRSMRGPPYNNKKLIIVLINSSTIHTRRTIQKGLVYLRIYIGDDTFSILN